MRGMYLRVLGCALAVLTCAAVTVDAAAQPRSAQPPVTVQSSPMSPATPSNPAGTAPPPTAVAPATPTGAVVPVAGDPGLCQCISVKTTRQLSCPGSPAECQANCSSTHFAFVPHAIYSCPTTPASANAASSPAQ
jgi:hypothetical protein